MSNGTILAHTFPAAAAVAFNCIFSSCHGWVDLFMNRLSIRHEEEVHDCDDPHAIGHEQLYQRFLLGIK
jgi:hypothetical protein